MPVDVLTAQELTAGSNSTDLDALLSSALPSFNVHAQPISDAATLVRPINLRGLSPDSTLVLINGKRRHRSSVITFLGGGISDGSHSPDLSSIPPIALMQAEVLRDGASAQYGSDAIAGVINLTTKNAVEGGSLETFWGTTYEGDGEMYSVAANVGLPLTENGFANLSFEFSETKPTSRSEQRADAQALIDGGNNAVRQPAVQVWGAPETRENFKFFGNMGINLGAAELYLFSNFATRETEGGFFYRAPSAAGSSSRRGVFVHPLETLNDEPAPLVARLPDGTMYSFDGRFPGGFTPSFGGRVTDWSLAGGMRGELSNDWNYDLSAGIGRHKTDFFIHNTINPQLLGHPDFRGNPNGIPTSYDPGNYIETDWIVNLDFSRVFDKSRFATGLEYRVETFEIEAGEEYSWWRDSSSGGIREQGFDIGTNGFPGFGPDVAGENSRGSYAAYADLENDLTEDWQLNTALRYEKHEDFGGVINGKISTRYQVTEPLALRASAGSGFRVPTVGQASVRNVTTSFSGVGDGLKDIEIIPATEVAAAGIQGAEPLKEESSINLSIGAVYQLNEATTLTLDYYHIQMKDRISLTSEVPAPEDGPLSQFDEIRWFANAFDTTTQGIDLVAESLWEHGSGADTTWTFAGSWTQTEVDSINLGFIDDMRVDQLENSLPDFRATFSVRHRNGAWDLLCRARYYDDFIGYQANSPAWRHNYDPRILVDAEVAYTLDGGLRLALGVENLFDTYPEKNPEAAIEGVGASYPENSPYGFNGGFAYVRASYTF